MLAFLEHKALAEETLTRLVRAGLVLGLLIWVPFLALGSQLEQPAHGLCVDFGMALVFVWLIHGARRSFGGLAGRVLSSPLATWLGKISYGIYVFHIPVRATLARLWSGGAMHPWALGLMAAIGTVLLAAASWRFFEKPLNDLKARFEYA